jgi:hypothetical protein
MRTAYGREAREEVVDEAWNTEGRIVKSANET